MEEAAWEPDDCISESLLYNQGNTNWSDYWPIIEDQKYYVYLESTSGISSFLKIKNKETGETNCLPSDLSFRYGDGAFYDEQFFTVKEVWEGNKTTFYLVSYTLEDVFETVWSKFYEESDETECFCTELLLHNGKAVVICHNRNNTDNLFVIDLITGESEKVCEKSDEDGWGSLEQINAYHNILFYRYRVKNGITGVEKNEIYRYDLKNKRFIDCTKLSIQRNYVVLDENQILFGWSGRLVCYDFLNAAKSYPKITIPDLFPESDYLGAEVGHIYCYSDYIFINEQKIENVNGEPYLLTYFVYSKDLTKRFASFQVLITEKDKYPPKSGIMSLRLTDMLFIANDTVYTQDRSTGVVLGCSLGDILNGKAEFTERYCNKLKE